MHPDGMQNAFEQAMKQRPTENYTPEEVNKFRDAFKDPEFRKMMAEYMADISDPKNRAEQEEYIRQLEGEGKVPEGKDLIKPKPGFAVKCYKVHKGVKDKLFINIVQSDRIERPTSRPEKDGVMWSVPQALGPPRIEKDNRGSHVTTFDCCFHPETVSKALMADAFRNLVVTTATDGVVKAFKMQGQTVEMAQEPFHVIRGVAYKTGEPAIMMVAKSQLSSPSSSSPAVVPSQLERPKQPPPADRPATSVKRDITGMPVNSECKASVSVTAAPPPSAPATSAAASSSPSLPPPPTATPGTTATTRTKAEAAATKGPKEPTFSIVERGKVVLADHMVAHPDKQRVASTRPKELVIKIELPLVKSASELDVNLSERRLLLTTTGGKYELDLALPYPVLEDEAAKFDKQRKVLTITVPVRQEEPKAVPSFLPTTDPPLSDQPSPSAESTRASRTDQPATDPIHETSTASEPMEAAPSTSEVLSPAAERARQTESKSGPQGHERWIDGSEERNDRLVVDQAEVAKVVEETQRKRASEQAEQEKAKACSSESCEGPDAPCDVSRDARVVTVGREGVVQEMEEKANEGGAESSSEPPFIAEKEFRGQRAGYVFKAWSQGMGYYKDAAQTPAGAPGSLTDTSDQGLEERACGRAVPPYKATQKETSFTLIVTVPDIDTGSVLADWGGSNGRTVTIDFEAVHGDGSTKPYRLGLNLAGRVDPPNCSYDVATRNMLVVLRKAEPIGHWSSLVMREEEGRSGGDPQYDDGVRVPSETVHARTEARPTKNVQFQNRMMMDME